LSHFVAVPHVVLDGKGIFRIYLVRAAEGVRFGDLHPGIKAIFILIGTKDTRNLHLRALAAIAQVAQYSGFEHSWLSARTHRELRDMFILSQRPRSSQ